MSSAAVSRAVFDMFRRYGSQDYLGENVSQIDHAIQCAMCAEKDGADIQTVLGALLHDIGHLSGQAEGQKHMVTGNLKLGIEKHDLVGEEFLRGHGIPDEITRFVRGHVDAKRYLTFKDKRYHESLSESSRMTLLHQGGPMSPEEALAFEKKPGFELMLKMRSWDEQAKDQNVRCEPLSKYELLLEKFMFNILGQ